MKKFGTRRRGALMSDALIAIFIVIAAALPAAGVVYYAYYSVVSSSEISGEFNEFGDKDVDERIWNDMNGEDNDHLLSSIKVLGAFTIPSIAGVASIDAEVVKIERTLKSGARRNVPMAVYMIRRP